MVITRASHARGPEFDPRFEQFLSDASQGLAPACSFVCPFIYFLNGLLSLVAEHSLCKRKVGGSIPPVGSFFRSWLFVRIPAKKTSPRGDSNPQPPDPKSDALSIAPLRLTQKKSTSTRFELARAEPSRFLIYLLNHSDTTSIRRGSVSEWLRR